MNRVRLIFVIVPMILFCNSLQAQKTYCNPLNLDYGYCPIPNFTESGKHRATADAVIVLYKGDYYLFSTKQMGYWWSTDLSHWNFVSRSFLKSCHKVYNCIMVYGANEYWLKSMDKEIPYFFRIEAINENGVSQLSEIIKSE